jgi:hypothetical protein
MKSWPKGAGRTTDTIRRRQKMNALTFDNAFIRDLPGDPENGSHRRQVYGALYSRVEATPVAAPRLIAHAPEVATAAPFPWARSSIPMANAGSCS